LGLVAEHIPQIKASANIIQTVCWTVAGLSAAVITDVVRRKIWPG
jgi:hypothetical protein